MEYGGSFAWEYKQKTILAIKKNTKILMSFPSRPDGILAAVETIRKGSN